MLKNLNNNNTTTISSDEISIITKYLIGEDTFILSKINKSIYENRKQYTLYDIKYEVIDKINEYQIKGIICNGLNKEVLKRILKLEIEQLGMEYYEDICLSELPTTITKLFLCNVPELKKTILPSGIKYFKSNQSEYSELDFSNCNKLQYYEIAIDEETEIILPKHKIETYTIQYI